MGKELSDFNTYVRLETQSVGSLDFLTKLDWCSSWCMFSVLLEYETVLAWNLQIPLKRSGYSLTTCLNDCIGALCSVFILKLSSKIPSFIHISRPKITDELVSAM